MGQTHYQALGVAKTATQDEIKKSWRKIAFDCHPDRLETQGLSPAKEREMRAQFKAASEAWEVLKEPQTRKEYNQGLRWRRKEPTQEEVWAREQRKRQREFARAVRRAEARRRHKVKLQEARRELENERTVTQKLAWKDAQERYLKRVVNQIRCKVGSYILNDEE